MASNLQKESASAKGPNPVPVDILIFERRNVMNWKRLVMVLVLSSAIILGSSTAAAAKATAVPVQNPGEIEAAHKKRQL